MRLTSSSIQRLLKASERTLVDAASASKLKDLSAARLRASVSRARTLKDKFTADAQALATKPDVFGVVLERLERQLARVDARLEKAAASRTQASSRKQSGSRKKTTTRTPAPKRRCCRW